MPATNVTPLFLRWTGSEKAGIFLGEGTEIKKISMICAVVLVLIPLSVPARAVQYVDRYVDILEPGNPGGWTTSRKTWDVEYTMNIGDTIAFDVWLGDTGRGFMEGSYWADYDPSELTMYDVQVYNGVSLPGPWDPGGTMIAPDAGGPGTYMVDCLKVPCIQPDSEGHMIIARGWIESKACGDTIIRFSDIPAV